MLGLSVGWSVGCSVGLSVGWSVGWSVDRSVGPVFLQELGGDMKFNQISGVFFHTTMIIPIANHHFTPSSVNEAISSSRVDKSDITEITAISLR